MTAQTETRQIEVRSPYDGSVVGTVPAQSAEDVDAACRRAAAALDRGWPQHERIRALEFGGVTVNEAPTFRTDQMPYGGVKASGNTREGPAWTVREMTEERLVVIQR